MMYALVRPSSTLLLALSVAVFTLILPCRGQSNRAVELASDGTWHFHSHIPLGADSLLLQPANKTVEMLASAEAPAFAGWTLQVRNRQPVLLDSAGHDVQALPRSITFRVTVSAQNKLANPDPMRLDCAKSLDDFLLDLHFRVQVFRGMQMRTVTPTRQWLIGVPADESSDERIYRVSFNLGNVRPDDRVVLLVTDGAGTRITKFHLEFL